MHKRILAIAGITLCLVGCGTTNVDTNIENDTAVTIEENSIEDNDNEEITTTTTEENNDIEADNKIENNLSEETVEVYLDKYPLVNTSYDGNIKLFANDDEDVIYIVDDKEEICLNLCWRTTRYIEPDVIKMDINMDGQGEYLLSTVTLTGTGVNIGQLYMVEKIKEQWEVREWEYDTIMASLDKRISYKYDEEYKIIEIYDKDRLICTGVLDSLLEFSGEKFEDISYGSILEIDFINGRPWLSFNIGILLSNRVMPDYDITMNVTSPLSFEKGEVVIGDLTMQSFFVPEGENSYDAGLTWEDIYTCYYDMDQDGDLDKIVVSGTVMDEYANPIDAIKAYGLGKIDVYEGYVKGTVDNSSRYEYAKSPLWTTTFSTSHAGNGQLSIVEKDGNSYFVESNLYCGMGSYSYNYKVFFPRWKELFVLEKDSVSFENELGDTTEFFDSLYKWIDKDAVLLYAADIDCEESLMISTEEKVVNARDYYELKK